MTSAPAMSLQRPLLLLFLLAAALNGRKARASGTEALRQSHHHAGGSRVSLCGRELIRAAVFICGGSRWKRVAEHHGGAEQPRHSGAEFVQLNSDKGMEDVKLQSIFDPELEQLQHIGQPTVQQPLEVLLNLYGGYDAYVPTSDKSREYIRQIDKVQQSRGSPGLAKLMRLNNFPWVNILRRKRDFSVRVADHCCRWGCTSTEISTLC